MIKDDIPTSLFKAPKANFNIIYNSMFHGNTDIQHNDIHKEAEKGAGKNKEMGKMTHKGATESVRKGEMRKGDHTAL